ncbi:hypothetical protein N8D56_25430 (plasmid) [Devosia sp. A8/3-2]|nr:hypothetical protein N8D56_25430 [Devosia sp. A8/3-2]
MLAKDTDGTGKPDDPTIAMIFQDPTSSLNPVHTIGYYLESSLYRHQGLKGADRAWRRCGCWNAWASTGPRAGCGHIPTSSRAA